MASMTKRRRHKRSQEIGRKTMMAGEFKWQRYAKKYDALSPIEKLRAELAGVSACLNAGLHDKSHEEDWRQRKLRSAYNTLRRLKRILHCALFIDREYSFYKKTGAKRSELYGLLTMAYNKSNKGAKELKKLDHKDDVISEYARSFEVLSKHLGNIAERYKRTRLDRD